MGIDRYRSSESESSENGDNSYCIFLHIVEGSGFQGRNAGIDSAEYNRNQVTVNASLNGVQFEVEGQAVTNDSAIVFNSNCIWECDIYDIKRLKTDNRPVKLECFQKSRKSEFEGRRTIGTLLLPIRGVQVHNTLNNNSLTLHWHKLVAVGSEWRENKPEIYLMLMILKRSILESGQLESLLGQRKAHRQSSDECQPNLPLSPIRSDTALMLQSQHNVYVQLLDQVGLIQVGNNPDLDCDILCVTLTFKQMRNFLMLLQNNCPQPSQAPIDNVFIFHYDFLGSNSYVEVQTLPTDCYIINDKISLTFKSSLRSLRMYFQCIFYVPMNIYYKDVIIANYRFDFSKVLPDDNYFDDQHVLWTKNGTFCFEYLTNGMVNIQAENKPSVDFIFTIQLVTSYRKKVNCNSSGYAAFPDLATSIRDLEWIQNVDALQNSFKKISCGNGSQTFRQDNSLLKVKLVDKCQQTISLPDENSDKEQPKSRAVEARRCMDSCTEFESLTINDDQHSSQRPHVDRVERREREMVEPLNTVTVGVNTEQVQPTEKEFSQDELCMKAVQELEEWKEQQMECFLKELARKEHKYLGDFKQSWELKRSELTASLEGKLAKCTRLNEELEKANAELSNERSRDRLRLAENIKKEFEEKYIGKFLDLDAEVQRLKGEIQRQENVFQLKSQGIQVENERLQKERTDLRSQVEKLERKFAALEDSHLPAEKLKDVLSDFNIKKDQYMEIEKSRDYYKEQWWKASQQIQKLRSKLLKMQEVECYRKESAKFNDCNLHLEDILNDEHEMLMRDRQELHSVKEVLLNLTDNSSSDQDETTSSIMEIMSDL